MRNDYYGEYPPRNCVLTRILEAEARNCLSEDDKARLLAPLRERIMSGEFTGPRRPAWPRLFMLLRKNRRLRDVR